MTESLVSHSRMFGRCNRLANERLYRACARLGEAGQTEDRERGDHPRRVLQRVEHPERYRPGLRARDRDEVFADNLAADVQGFFAVAGPVEAPAGGDMSRGSHESGRDENVGIDEHPGQGSPPDAFSGPPARLPESS